MSENGSYKKYFFDQKPNANANANDALAFELELF